MEINKYFKILLGLVGVLIVLAIVWFFLVLFGVVGKKGVVQEPLPEPKDLGEITTVYGAEIHDVCLKQYQNFIENHGSDYSKCLNDFEFDKNYCEGFDPDTEALSDVNIIVILDSSGSMAQKITFEEKINVAKKAVSDFLTKMPQGVNTGLVVYGHKGSNLIAQKDLSCKGVEEIVKLGKNDYNDIISAMNSFEPKGWTPIAGSLDFAKNIFKNSGQKNKNYLILLSDGAESCDGNPLFSAEDLKLQIPGVKLTVIGFATDYETQKSLVDIARLGGGSFLSAYDTSTMVRAFDEQLLIIKKDCINMSLLRMYSQYNTNNLNNLNCWLAAYDEELGYFDEGVLEKSFDKECNSEISDVLVARSAKFWNDKEDIKDKNNAIYKETEADLNKQLEALGN